MLLGRRHFGRAPKTELMSFRPPFCPFDDCQSHKSRPFLWRKKGTFPRKCDGRRIQRFFCRCCTRSFSSQTFRVDYRLHLVHLTTHIFSLLVSKVSQRQTARIYKCHPDTVARRLSLFANHCKQFHQQHLAETATAGGVQGGYYQLDEMETFETNRRVQPVTIPVLIERNSYFVIHAESADLPSRGRLTEYHQKKKIEYEEKHGKRRSGSRRAVKNTLERLEGFVDGPICFQSDYKSTYISLLFKLYRGRIGKYELAKSSDPRIPGSLLFPINQTLAMMRDGMSRLVRRSWCHAKKRGSIDKHMWLWICWRNYIRGITVVNKNETPAMALGVSAKQWSIAGLLRWRVFRHPFFVFL